jgi:inhibitor of cysteine peptidase
MLQIDKALNGGEVEVGLGESFEVRLPENPTTGYRWRQRSSGEPAVALQADSFHPAGEGVGAGGTRDWQFRAVHEGVARLQLEYRRGWESHAAETFTVTVRVRPG